MKRLSPEELARMRHEYADEPLNQSQVGADPLAFFEHWLHEARGAGAAEPNAMSLATRQHNGRPAARVVLLKEVEGGGFVFYTNYNSPKGEQLMAHPAAALTFFWPELARQVRIEGEAAAVAPEQSDLYFARRPRGAQLGAHASAQSSPLANREELVARFEEVEKRYENEPEIPRPPHWGGFRLVPDLIEFWQGRPSRLHDRIVFRRQQQEDGGWGPWSVERLAP